MDEELINEIVEFIESVLSPKAKEILIPVLEAILKRIK